METHSSETHVIVGCANLLYISSSMYELLLTPPSRNVVFTSPKSKPNNFSYSTSLQRKIETVKRFTK